MTRYLRFYFEGLYNAAIGPITGWIGYHSVLLAAWFGNVDLSQIDSIAKLIGIIVGIISSLFVARHVHTQTKNLQMLTNKTEMETEKLKLETEQLKFDMEQDRKRLEMEKDLADEVIRRAKNGTDSEKK